MLNLHHAPLEVHPDFGTEPFEPSPLDLAYDLGWSLARAGENPLVPYKDIKLGMRFVAGRVAGRVARDIDEARQLGEAVAYLTGISEPPAGLSADEKAAYRVGFARGTVLFELERQEDTHVASLDDEGLAIHYRIDLTDADIWPSLGSYT
jgi:hypothetical protein